MIGVYISTIPPQTPPYGLLALGLCYLASDAVRIGAYAINRVWDGSGAMRVAYLIPQVVFFWIASSLPMRSVLPGQRVARVGDVRQLRSTLGVH